MKKAIIIGAGFAGCTMAYLLKKRNYTVTLLEKESVLGGGCRTYFYKGHPYTLGPRHLNVDKTYEDVWSFLTEHMDLRMLEHRACTFPSNDNRFFAYPPVMPEIQDMQHAETIKQELAARDLHHQANSFESYWENAIGKTLYEGFVKHYSEKMWGIDDNNKLVFNVKQLPVHRNVPRPANIDYFDGKQWCAYPKNLDGYNPYFDMCVEGCEVRFSTHIDQYDIANRRVKVGDDWLKGDVLISSISLDQLCNYAHGELQYKGRDLIKVILPIARITPEPYYFLYYAGDEPYTRIFEYKLITGYVSDYTLIGIEIPSDSNKLYPFPLQSEVDKADAYKRMLPQNVFSIGRMGNYKYDCIADVIKQCFNINEVI